MLFIIVRCIGFPYLNKLALFRQNRNNTPRDLRNDMRYPRVMLSENEEGRHGINASRQEFPSSRSSTSVHERNKTLYLVGLYTSIKLSVLCD